MNSGKNIRFERLFAPDGKTMIAALDHGIAGLAPLGALQRPDHLIRTLAEARVDAFIVTPGMAEKFSSSFGGKGLIVRVDCGATALTGEWAESQPALTVQDAVRLGADAVVAMGVVGAAGESRSLQALARLARDCEHWGMVLVAEMLPGGFGAHDCSVEHIAIAARVGAELGADLIKIRSTGTGETFRAVTEACYQPVVVLGGAKQDPSQLAASMREAVAAGARGVAVGRNLWQADDPGAVASLLVGAVHG